MTQSVEQQSAFEQLRAAFAAPITRVIWGVGTILLSLIAPFDMAETTTLFSRAVYWFALIGCAIGISLSTKYSVMNFFPGLAPLHLVALTAFIFAAAYTPVIYLANYLILPNRMDSLGSFPEMFGLVLLIFFCLAAVISVIQHQYATPAPITPPTPAASLLDASLQGDARPALVRRLEHQLQSARIIRLSMQDHYVEVHTDAGSQLILMRMSDAITELDGIEGLQVHRSHWVALDAVTGSKREKGRIYLVTRDGGAVPVSRSHAATVREFGLV